jgi:hypothetical protein
MEIFTVEAWLSGWKKSTSTSLPQVTLNFEDDEDLAFFEQLTIAKGKRAGQILDCAFSLSDQDGQEKPVKGGPYSQEAGRLCKEPAFWEYVLTQIPVPMDDIGEDDAVNWLKVHCGIHSRKELDTNPVAFERFKALQHDMNEWVGNS